MVKLGNHTYSFGGEHGRDGKLPYILITDYSEALAKLLKGNKPCLCQSFPDLGQLLLEGLRSIEVKNVLSVDVFSSSLIVYQSNYIIENRLNFLLLVGLSP